MIGDARYGAPQHNGDESETMMSDSDIHLETVHNNTFDEYSAGLLVFSCWSYNRDDGVTIGAGVS